MLGYSRSCVFRLAAVPAKYEAEGFPGWPRGFSLVFTFVWFWLLSGLLLEFTGVIMVTAMSCEAKNCAFTLRVDKSQVSNTSDSFFMN